MDSLAKYEELLDFKCVQILILKTKDLDFFIQKSGKELGEQLYKDITTAKSGLITVYKVSDNPGIEKGKVYTGVTTGFNTGISVHISDIDGWFESSVIQEIDWDKSEFRTMNSVYHFDFQELDDSQVIEHINHLENDSKNKD